MYGMANYEMDEQKAIRDLMGMAENLMKMCDAYVTSEQSKVIVETLTKLHDAKQLTDYQYKESMIEVLKQNGFDVLKYVR